MQSGAYLLRWRWGEVGDSVLRATSAPIEKLLIGKESAWSNVTSQTRGTTGGLAIKVFTDKDHPLRMRFGSAHVTFMLRFDDYDEEECELALLGVLGATEEGIVKSGWAVVSLKPQTGGDSRAGLDVSRDGRLKRRGREGGLKTKEAYDVAKAGGSMDAAQAALFQSKQAATKRQAEAAAGASAKKAAVAAAPANVEGKRAAYDAAAARSGALDGILGDDDDEL